MQMIQALKRFIQRALMNEKGWATHFWDDVAGYMLPDSSPYHRFRGYRAILVLLHFHFDAVNSLIGH